VKTKWNTGKAQLNENLSLGLVFPVCNLSYSGDSGRRSMLPTAFSPYLPCFCSWVSSQVTQLQQLCEFFWLQDHRDITWTRQKREMVRGRLGICSAGWRKYWIQSYSGFHWALSILESASWSHCWGLRFAIWLVVVDWGPWTQSHVLVRWLQPSPQPCWEFLPVNPYLANEVAGGTTVYLCSLCWVREVLCSVPPTLNCDLASL
jgi:hypothetical protein